MPIERKKKSASGDIQMNNSKLRIFFLLFKYINNELNRNYNYNLFFYGTFARFVIELELLLLKHFIFEVRTSNECLYLCIRQK